MYEEIFQAVDIDVVELPIEMIDEQPKYSAYLRQLPFIAAEGSSRKAVFRQLAEAYANYRQNLEKEAETAEKQLTLDELLCYYDGETIDGYSDFFKETD